MRVVYYALRPTQVGDDIRQPGDLVPEASNWPFLTGYVSDGKLAPVLVATLPEEQQIMLLDWEEAQSPEPKIEPVAEKSTAKPKTEKVAS